MNERAGASPVPVDRVRGSLDAAGVDYDLQTPRGLPELTELITEEAKSGRDHFCVVGGDGTVNALVNVLMGLDLGIRPTIGVLPAGTGCDLLRTFGIPQDLGPAARHLLGDQVYAIDVPHLEGEWGMRHFVNVAQAGVGAAAAQSAPRLSRRLGSGRYPLAFAARLPRFPRGNVRLETERRTIESPALAVILANAQFFAGGWNIAPKATLIDGVLDVQVINAPKRAAPGLVPKIIKGTHLRDPAVRRLSAGEFDLEVDVDWPVEADGDYLGNTRVSGRVVPAAINLKI